MTEPVATDTPPDPTARRGSPLATIAAAFVAVLAVALNCVDARLGSEQAQRAANGQSLAFEVTARVAGGAYGADLRCEEGLLREEVEQARDTYEQFESAGAATPVDRALARVAARASGALDDAVAVVETPIPTSIGLHDEAVDALSTADCTFRSVMVDAFESARLVGRQNAEVAAAADVGRGRSRVSLGLTLIAISGAVLAWSEADRSRSARRLLAVTGATLLVAAVVWGATGLAAA